jgi:hypothetical protein
MTQGSMPTTGRWGQYQDHEGNTFRRVSTLIKEVETDTRNLDLWKQRQVAEGMAVRDDLVLAVKAMGRPPATGWTKEQKAELNKIVDTAMEAAKVTDGATTGTAVHTLTERVDRGEPIDAVAAGLPAEAAQTLRAYAGLRELNGWRTVEIERTVVCDVLEVAGTFDRIDYVPGLAAMLGPGDCQYGHAPGDHGEAVAYDGELPVIVDVKTEKDPTRNGLHIGPQLAIYSRGTRMWRPLPGTHDLVRNGEVVRYRDGNAVQVPNGEYVPAPCVRQDVAIVVHALNGDANPLLVNLTEGWSAAIAAHEQINRKSRAGRRVGSDGAWFVPLPTKKPDRLSTFVATAAAADYANPNRPGPGEVVTPAEQVAVRDPATGLVSWHDARSDVGAGIAIASESATDAVRGDLIAAIWKARTVDALAILWKMAGDRNITWSGPIAMAGDARRRQIECPQRALHTGDGKCACGWIAGQIP